MQVKIEKLVYGGEGLAHHDGHAVFVPFVMPGEVVAVQPAERRKKFIRGRLERVIAPSPQRAAGPCKHFTVCGGCNYQHIPYPAQLEFKAQILRETLGRLGGIQYAGEIATHASAPYGYRNRAQWKVRAGNDNGEAAGIGYQLAGSHALCPIEQCPILVPSLEAVVVALRGLIEQRELPATLSEVEAFLDPKTGRLLLNASFARFASLPQRIAETLRGALPQLESLLLHEATRDRFELDGPGYIFYDVGGTNYRVGHLSFFQVNHTLLDPLRRAVARGASGKLAFELYAGVGLFTLPLAESFERVVAVEANPAAVRDLNANLEASKKTAAVQVAEASAEKFLGGVVQRPDLVVLDPPRAGVASAAIEQLARIGPPRIRYFSCDPATLARDLAALRRHTGEAYEIAAVELFDLFPQTYHIETLVELVRRT